MRIHNELKDTIFNDLESLNHAVWILLDKHNSKKLTQRPYSRLDLFDEDEKAHLKPLPLTRFEIKNQSFATVMQNGHVQLSEDKNYYSVPFQYIRKKVKLLYTKTDVEIYHKFNRIALHKRSLKPYSYTSNPEHLASEHLFVSEWSAARFIDWANSINEHVGNYIIEIIESRNHPEQAFKSCLGILSLEKKVGKERLVKACMRALDIQVYSYKTIQNILENNLENMSDESAESIDLPSHHNIRGKNYYN